MTLSHKEAAEFNAKFSRLFYAFEQMVYDNQISIP